MKQSTDPYIRNDRESELAAMAERLADRFAERSAKHDREGSFPFDHFGDLKQAGYLKLTVPAELGGDEISLYELVLLQDRLAYGDGSTALAVGWHIGLVMHLNATGKWPRALYEQLCKDIVSDGIVFNSFASEPASGSPSRGGKPETTAVRTEGGWLITGRKTFSTASPIVDRFVVSAYVPEEERVSEFLVFKGKGVSIEETWNTLGMRATGSHDVVLDHVFVSSDARIDAQIPEGREDAGGWLLHIPACYIGIARAARDFALDFAGSYRPNSLSGSIAELPTVQQSIGQMEAELRIARNFLYSTADRYDRQTQHKEQMRPDLGLAKYAATNAAIRVVDIAMRIVGGASLSKTLPLERYYRDVRAGLHNPPMENNIMQLLAVNALSERNI
ncbi:acyl-CoA dehydrogenase family protein [Marinicrinis lubricantis]